MLVTGAGRGIGRAIAEHAAAAGYAVVCHHRSDPAAAGELAARLGGTAVQADFAQPKSVLGVFEHVDAHHGRLDALVNNAATATGYGTLDRLDAVALSEMLAVNVTSAFVACREAIRRLPDGGSIVNISSRAAQLGGAGEWVDYAATKGAIETLTRGLALEVAARGIRVNGVRPGLIDTDFHLHAPAGRVERMAPGIPMQRPGSADEVAAAVLWLCSPAASYVTGSFIDVSGGR